jgi:hypothetical protein
MRTEFMALLVGLAALCAAGQGSITYQYDQQSSTNEGNYGHGTGPSFGIMSPTGQGFTPALSAIDFIKLEINDASATGTVPSTWLVGLHSTSITGPLLGSASVTLPGAYSGAASFIFPNTISLTPGTEYWFDINTADGGAWHILFDSFNYQGGNAWVRGGDYLAGDYWFREGIIVPEPSSAALLLLAAAALACLRRKNRT